MAHPVSRPLACASPWQSSRAAQRQGGPKLCRGTSDSLQPSMLTARREQQCIAPCESAWGVCVWLAMRYTLTRLGCARLQASSASLATRLPLLARTHSLAVRSITCSWSDSQNLQFGACEGLTSSQMSASASASALGGAILLRTTRCPGIGTLLFFFFFFLFFARRRACC